MKALQTLLWTVVLGALFPQTCLAIAGPDPSIATTAQLPQFSALIGTGGLLQAILDLAKNVFFVVAVLFVIIAGYQYLTARGEEEKVKKATNSMIYSALGIAVVALADVIVNVFKTLQNPDASAGVSAFQSAIEAFLNTVLGAMQYLAGTIAVFFLLLAAYNYITAAGNDERTKNATQSLIYSLVGMVVVALSYTGVNVMKTITGTGTTPSLGAFQTAVEGFLTPVLTVMQYLSGIIAVFFLLVAAYNYITAAGNEERTKKATQSLIYSITGLVVLVLARTVVNVLATLKQESTTATTPVLDNFQTATAAFLQAILNGMQSLAGAIAILFIIIAAYRYITAGGNEEQTKKGTQSLLYSLGGLALMVVSGVVKSIFKFNAATGTEPATTTISAPDVKAFISSIVIFATSFVGGLAILMLVYAGFLWITARGEDEQVSKAKKLITYAVIGLIIIIFAYALVSLVLNVGQAPTT